MSADIDDVSSNGERTIAERCDRRKLLVVLAAFLIQVTGLGTITSVMQDYYEQHRFGTDPATVIYLSFVGSIANFVLNLLGIFVQILISYTGLRSGIFIAGILCTGGLELASLSTEIWHLYLTQGVLFGAGCSIIFYVGMSSVSEWFDKRRGVALGIVSSGACVGGLLIPFLMSALNRSLGSGWCYRIMGYMSFVVCVISCLLFKEKEEYLERKQERKTIRGIIKTSILKDAKFALWCTADILMEMGYYVPYFFLPSYATYLGLSDSYGSALISIASATNSMGRILAGWTADKIGHLNTVIITGFVSGMSALLLWTMAHDFTILCIFAAVFGFFGGVFIALGPSITMIVSGTENFASAYSLFLLITVISMFGPNIAGAMEAAIASTAFNTYKIFTGVAYLSGTLLLVFLKLTTTSGKVLAKI
ncbi:major facilitator superfamily domain-containing protein [Radiomyces spectabilis]|uniref:major facilitator superfamily domain-containing protein n=1 Tax=Radiomyces spectabilis TaxID=64574 RepID=UPI00221EFA88|nr:major facilitator superfamily domain-containing protein [Radiomyces spectabilis]KAI8394334.1 major facilitator superfamily domain-containing protein [Radiomyces spectabilis]